MRSSQIFRYSYGNLIFTLISILAYLQFRSGFIVFLPLCFSFVLLLLAPYEACIGIILTYVCFDGMLKIISSYNPVLHVGPDLVVVAFVIRLLIDGATHRLKKKLLRPPLVLVFVLHFLWVTVEITNPYGLGFWAGLAAYKIYMTFLLLYFLSFSFITDTKSFAKLMWVSLVIMLIQTVSGIYQFDRGLPSLLAISPNYAKVFMGQFAGVQFRPFGTSAVPGGPSTWIFLTMPLTLALFLSRQSKTIKVGIILCILASAYMLFMCQVRSATLKCAFGFTVAVILIYWRSPLKLLSGMLTLIGSIYAYQLFLLVDDPRFNYAKKRLNMLYDITSLRNARAVAVWDRIFYFWDNAPFGIGLSRTGAASSLFVSIIEKDKLWGIDWSFTDNLFLTLITELGFIGSIFYLTLVYVPPLIVTWRMIKYSSKINEARYLVGGALGLVVASLSGHYGSEASLYSPECIYFWIFLGAAMKLSEKKYLA
jgi:hypothetical protein